jgi:phospholipid/cholesterol/gamma-HCH transport system substrate-binding protein
MEQFHSASTTMNSILDENKTDIRALTISIRYLVTFLKFQILWIKADLGKTVKNLNKTLVRSGWDNERLEAGNGTMGKLLNDDTI